MLKDSISMSQPLRNSGYNEYLLGKMQNKNNPQDYAQQLASNSGNNSLMDTVSSFATELRSQNVVRAMATAQQNNFGMKPTLAERGASIDNEGNVTLQKTTPQQITHQTPQKTLTQENARPLNSHNAMPLNGSGAIPLTPKRGIALDNLRPMALDSRSLSILNRIATREEQGISLSSRDRKSLLSAREAFTKKVENTVSSEQLNNYELGSLSRKYESAQNGSISIGYDKNGGTSYGTYQFSSRVGTFNRFLKFLDKEEPEWAERLRNAGPANTGSRKGAVPSTWIQLCQENPKRMKQLEHDFIVKSHFEPVLSYVKEKWQSQIAPAVKEVLFSTSVQHGVNGAKYIVDQALTAMKHSPKPQPQTEENGANLLMANLGSPNSQVSLAETKSFIENIYENRKNKFWSSTPRVQEAARRRMVNEKNDALNMLG